MFNVVTIQSNIYKNNKLIIYIYILHQAGTDVHCCKMDVVLCDNKHILTHSMG